MSRCESSRFAFEVAEAIAFPLLLVSALATIAPASSSRAKAASDDLPAQCARLGTDDTVRDYQPSLRAGTVKAFRAMFPGSKADPEDAMLEAQAKFRCMNGRLHVCFIGANLPCGKLDTSRQNEGADAFCRTEPEADFVPMAAVGHASIYVYRCHEGKAEVLRATYELDERGFAKTLWMALPEGT